MNQTVNIGTTNIILPNTGRAALINGQQVAVFHIKTGAESEFFAVDNFCPFARANVLSRGITGCVDGKVVVASPVYKQHFDLKTGVCLEDESVSVKTWPIAIEGDSILISTETTPVAA